MPAKAYTAEKIFTGEEWLTERAVIVDDGMITDIISRLSLPASIPLQDFDSSILTPALIDLQLYGAYGKLLSEFPDVDSLVKLQAYCASGGAAYCLPTVATNTSQVFHQCIDAIRTYWQQDGMGVLGIHLEGPWINPLKRGAHIATMIHSPSIQEVTDLLEYGKGVIKMITLAPEVCSNEIIQLIRSHNIVVSAGHSNASYQEAQQGFAAGIATATHLYNAMSPLKHRSPGLVGAVMTDEKAMCSIIPDGHHVDYAAIRIAKEVMKDRLFVITDAVTETTSGPYPHSLAGDKYEAGGILSGSALIMSKAINNLVAYAGIERGEAIRMCSLYPARLMGLDHQLGKISKGYRAVMSVFDEAGAATDIIYG